MANINDLGKSVKIPQMVCACGRDIPPRHCPACGSTNVYGKDANARLLKLASGEQVLLRGFKCRRCTLEFNEGTPCEAPANASMRQRRDREKQAEQARLIRQLPPEQRRAELAKLFDKLNDKAAGADAPKEDESWTEKNPIFEDKPKPPDDSSGTE